VLIAKSDPLNMLMALVRLPTFHPLMVIPVRLEQL